MASWAQRFVGVFVEKVEDEEPLPEALTPAPSAPAPRAPRREVSRPQVAAAAKAAPAPVYEAEIPDAIKQVIDAQFQDAASPALSAWSDLNDEFAETLEDPGTRTKIVLKTMSKLGHSPAAIYVDIGECRTKLSALRSQIEDAKDSEIQDKVTKTEQRAEACQKKIADLRLEIEKLEAEEIQLNESARDARLDIEQNHASSLRYIDLLSEGLLQTTQEVRVASPETPVPAAISGQKV